MPDYTKNNANAYGGHTQNPKYFNTNSELDRKADVRDMISALVSAGKTGLRPDDRKAVYSALVSNLGQEQANNLLNHINIFNQRTDIAAKNTDQLLSQFYDMGSRNPQVNQIIQTAKGLGEGPVSGANQSSYLVNQEYAGKSPLTGLPTNDANLSKVSADVTGL